MEKIEQLEQETVEVGHLKEALVATNERARKLARALKNARSVTQQAAPVPAALSSAEVSTELENLSCGVIIGDANHKINRVNAAASHMLMRRNNNLIGSELTTIFEDERWQKALEQLKSKNEPMVSTTLKGG